MRKKLCDEYRRNPMTLVKTCAGTHLCSHNKFDAIWVFHKLILWNNASTHRYITVISSSTGFKQNIWSLQNSNSVLVWHLFKAHLNYIIFFCREKKILLIVFVHIVASKLVSFRVKRNSSNMTLVMDKWYVCIKKTRLKKIK